LGAAGVSIWRLMQIAFYILGLLVIAGAVAAVSFRKPIHCALSLAVALAAVAGNFLLLGAEFVGFAQILVYVGAVAVLMVFVILLTRENASGEGLGVGRWMIGAVIAAGVFGVLAACVLSSKVVSVTGTQPEVTARAIGEQLMSTYVLPMETLGLLLTAAAIGAVVVAMSDKKQL
jgi:NADH-quinone oxidoreductase subunit J